MMDEKELIANYEQLRLERGWSYETLADYLQADAPNLAKAFRGKADDDADPTPAPEAPAPEAPAPEAPAPATPKGRRTPAKAKTSAAAETVESAPAQEA